VRRADHSFRGVLPNVVCLTACDRVALIIRSTRGCCAVGAKKC
jgi:hypothetical protein